MEWNINEPDQFFENKEDVKTEQEGSNVIPDPPALEDGVKPDSEQNAVNAETIKYEASDMLADSADHNEYIDMAVVTFVKLENTEHETEGKYMYTNILQITNEGSMMDDVLKQEPPFIDTAYTEITGNGECSTATPGDNIHGSSTSSTSEKSEVFDHVERSGNCSVPSYNYFIEADKKLMSRPVVLLSTDLHLEVKTFSEGRYRPIDPRSWHLVCSHCGKMFNSSQELRQHCSEHVRKLGYKCTLCGQEHETEDSCTRHQCTQSGRASHTPVKAYTYQKVGMGTKNKKNLRRPEKGYASGNSSKRHRSVKSLECRECEKKYHKPNQLVNHMRSHTGERPFSCDKCGKRFMRRNALTEHMQRHSTEKPFVCTVCGKGFKSNGTCKRHLLVHESSKKIACKQCGKLFKGELGLEGHQRSVHKGEKPHVCEICGKRFARHSAIIVHRKRHTGEKPHSCKFCGKCFTTPFPLKDHMLTHTGEKPHLCDICGKCFRTCTQLSAHKLYHSGERPHKCFVCGKGFVVPAHLRAHLCTHGKD